MKSLLTSLFLTILTLNSISQTQYVWNGSVNSTFSTAGNWTPLRQYMYATDILIIDKGGNVSITNVNQVTVGQLIIKNNTQVTMSPNAGNPRVLSIQGSAGEDFLIESGSSLTITGNDPKLSIYVKTGATAAIFGSLTFSGNKDHTINSQDSLAVVFKSGSSLFQNSIGSVFSTTGVQNSIVFNSGSSFIINNVYACSPFGLQAPASKVKFEKGSNFILASVISNCLRLNSRALPNLKILTGINFTISDTLNNGLTFDSLNIPSGSSLNIINSLPGMEAYINIKGSMEVNGNLTIGDALNSSYRISFCGSSLQNISGTGNIIFPTHGLMVIDNDIKLFRNLTVNCSVNQSSGTIYANGFTLRVNGRYNNITNLTENTEINNIADGSNNNNAPVKFNLSQNYPNPFNSQTVIEFSIPSSLYVSMKLYDITGKQVSDIVNKDMQAGTHKVNYDSKDLSSGVYFYTIIAAGFNKTMKMIVVK